MRKLPETVLRFIASIVFLGSMLCCFANKSEAADQTYGKGFRTDSNGWIFLHIEGSPSRRGEQHGYLLATEIRTYIEALKLYVTSNSKKTWNDYRLAASDIMLPKIEKEYVNELKGILKGMGKANVTGYDIPDLVALNSFMEIQNYFYSVSSKFEPYRNIFRRTINRGEGAVEELSHCSAFIATGSATSDGGIVLAHNTWVDYVLGGNIIIDLKPSRGLRMLMQCIGPGLIHSYTDFAINSAGIVMSETTISYANGFDTEGIPEFVRMRKAAQYSKSIDDFYSIIRKGNNGGYANTWLVGDIKTNEIAKIELGLKNVAFYRSKDGYYDGMNYVDDSKMIREECSPSLWDVSNGSWPVNLSGGNSCSARRMRWFSLLDQNKGLIDAENAKVFLADQINQMTGQPSFGGKGLMCRLEILPSPNAYPFGATDGKVVTSELARNMSFWARIDHPDGSTFEWADFFTAYPQFAWQKPYLHDLKDNPWTLFKSTKIK